MHQQDLAPNGPVERRQGPYLEARETREITVLGEQGAGSVLEAHCGYLCVIDHVATGPAMAQRTAEQGKKAIPWREHPHRRALE